MIRADAKKIKYEKERLAFASYLVGVVATLMDKNSEGILTYEETEKLVVLVRKLKNFVNELDPKTFQ